MDKIIGAAFAVPILMIGMVIGLLVQVQIWRLQFKYGLTADERNELFFFLIGRGGLRRLYQARPELVRKEFPEVPGWIDGQS